MTYDELKVQNNALYPVNKVAKGYKYWLNSLTEKCMGMFSYTGLPDSLPAEEIERRLMLNGYAGIFKHATCGMVTAWGGMSGQDMYYHPTHFIYAQPVLHSATLKIHDTVAIIYNSDVDQSAQIGLSELIRRYARMLADIDSSINIVVVNLRAMNMCVADNDTVAKSVDAVMAKIQQGNFATINQASIMDSFKTFPFSDNRNSAINELLLARESMLKAFYREIGVKSAISKKERLITDEVASDDQLLYINLADMLRWRKKGIAEVNKLFATSITVEISSEYLQEDEGSTDNESI